MTTPRKRREQVAGWSCDERDRAACRNAHGCHCREITALQTELEEMRSRNYAHWNLTRDDTKEPRP